jgi:hypothetical protein
VLLLAGICCFSRQDCRCCHSEPKRGGGEESRPFIAERLFTKDEILRRLAPQNDRSSPHFCVFFGKEDPSQKFVPLSIVASIPFL